jgi:hypothetical protein
MNLLDEFLVVQRVQVEFAICRLGHRVSTVFCEQPRQLTGVDAQPSSTPL